MAGKQSANITAKAGAKLGDGRFKKGHDPRRNVTKPGPGRPENESSITYWMRQFASMTPVQVADYCEVFAKELRKHPGDLPIAGVIAVRALMQQMDDPQPGMFGHVIDRIDGALDQSVTVNGNDEKPLTIHIIREGGYAEPSEPASGAAEDQAGSAAL